MALEGCWARGLRLARFDGLSGRLSGRLSVTRAPCRCLFVWMGYGVSFIRPEAGAFGCVGCGFYVCQMRSVMSVTGGGRSPCVASAGPWCRLCVVRRVLSRAPVL